MQAGFSYFDKKAPTAAIRSLFDKYDANSNGRLEEQEIQFLLEGELGLNQGPIFYCWTKMGIIISPLKNSKTGFAAGNASKF